MNKHALILLSAVAVLTLGPPTPSRAQDSPQGYWGQKVSDSDLRALIYDDNVPGFRKRPQANGAVGPFISTNGPEDYGRIAGDWETGDGLTTLLIAVHVTPSPEAAVTSAFRRMHGSSAALIEDHPDDRIGARSWCSIGSQTAILVFVSGRVFVTMNLVGINRREPGAMKATIRSPMDPHLDEVARTLARGLEWVIRQHPDMMAETPEGQSRTVVARGNPVSAPALTFRNTAWASLDALKQAGAKVAWDAKSGKASVSYGGKTIELTALRRHARLNGEGFDLGAGVMVDRSGPIVPLRKIAEALGMKVKATKTTIEIG